MLLSYGWNFKMYISQVMHSYKYTILNIISGGLCIFFLVKTFVQRVIFLSSPKFDILKSLWQGNITLLLQHFVHSILERKKQFCSLEKYFKAFL